MKRHGIRPGQPPKAKLNAQGVPKERFESLRLEDFREWVRLQPCAVASKDCLYYRRMDGTRISDATHYDAKARGVGDEANLIPFCRVHHNEQHTFGPRSFEREHKVKLGMLAGATWEAYEAERIGHDL